MSTPAFVAVSGPSGCGKTTWIKQFLTDETAPLFYLYPGLGNVSVDLMRIGYTFPWVQVIPESQLQQVLTTLPDEAVVYLELGFHLNLDSPFLSALPCRQVAVLPPHLQDSEWHQWADEICLGNDIAIPDAAKPPELWHTPLQGQVFDPPSLEVVLTELTGGAYGKVHRLKGIFEMPDGQALGIDFVAGLEGIEYTELNIPRWLEGRPNRYSGIEVIGDNLEQEIIAQTLLDGSLADETLFYYQQQYKTLNPVGEAISV
ncbi:MAG: GTP-binding protein [Thermosynechococcaceae cyanobacterium]